MNENLEYCCKCGEATGKAGIGDGSLYDENTEEGPYCEICYEAIADKKEEPIMETKMCYNCNHQHICIVFLSLVGTSDQPISKLLADVCKRYALNEKPKPTEIPGPGTSGPHL